MFLRTSRTYAVRQSAYWGSFLTLTYELPTGYPGISFRSGSNSVAFTVNCQRAGATNRDLRYQC